MARKTITTTTEEEEEDKIKDAHADAELDEDVIRALTEMEGTDEIRWQIYRLSEPDKGFVCVLSTAELTVERIAELGAGRYRVRGIKEDGKYFKSRIITIAKQPQAQNPVSLITEILEKNKSGGMETMQFLTLLMNQAQQQSQQMTQVMVAALTKKEEPRTEIPWGAIVAALPPSLVALKEFFANKSDPMKQMMDAITLTEKLRGDGDKAGTTWPDLLKEGLATIPATLQSLKSNPTPAPAHQPIEAHTVPPMPGPVTTPEAIPAPNDMNLTLITWLRDMIARLLNAAIRNGNVELYAEMFVEEIPDSVTDEQVIALLSADDWWQKLTMFESKLIPYQVWFGELRENIILVLKPDGESDDRRSNDARETKATHQGTIRDITDGESTD